MKTLLIIEDDETYAVSLIRALSRRGYSCLMASDANSALRLSKTSQPTHILLDLKLGNEDGQKLVAPLRDLLPHAHVVILTGHGTIPSTVEAMRDGATSYLCKPATPEQIDQALQQKTPQIESNLRELQDQHIQKVLKECEGNISQTARILGVDRRTLQRRLKRI